jgi:hypothetical protein
MHQQPWSNGLSRSSCQPWAVDTIQLWLEEEDEEESRRIGELKEQQRKKQKLFEEKLKQRQEQTPSPPGPLHP